MERTINEGLDTTREFKGKREISSVDLMIKCNSLSKHLLIKKKKRYTIIGNSLRIELKTKIPPTFFPLKKYKKDHKHYNKGFIFIFGIFFVLFGDVFVLF